MAFKWLTYQGLIFFILLICCYSVKIGKLDKDNDWSENEVFLWSPNDGFIKELENILIESAKQGLTYALDHQKNDDNTLLHNVTGDQYLIMQMIYWLQSGDEVFAKLALRLASNIKETNMDACSTWVEGMFQLSNYDVYNVLRNFIRWNNQSTYLNKFMAKLADSYDIYPLIFLKKDSNTMEWLLHHVRVPDQIKKRVFTANASDLDETMVDVILKNIRENEPRIAEVSKNFTFIKSCVKEDNFPVLSYIIRNHLIQVDHILNACLMENNVPLFVKVLHRFILAEGLRLPDPVLDQIIAGDRVDVLKALVAIGYSVDSTPEDQRSLGNGTLFSNSLKFVELPRKSEANANLGIDCNQSLLHKASFSGKVNIVNYLLEKGANMYTNCKGRIPICGAVVLDDEKIVQAFLKKHFDVNYQFPNGDNLLFLAIRKQSHKVLNVLIKNGIDVDRINHAGWTPLLHAILLSNTDAVKVLIQSGSNVSKIFHDDGSTYLHHAVIMNSDIVVSRLLEHGIPVEQRNLMGETALAIAVKYEMSKMIDLILSHCTKVGYKLHENYVHKAVSMRKPVSLERLLMDGLSLHMEDQNGKTPLMLAAEYDDTLSLKILLKFGANILQPKANSSKSLMHYAASWGSHAVVELLVQNLSTNIKDADGFTPLHEAAENGQLEIVEFLLANLADVNSTTTNGTNLTPLHLASMNGYSSIVYKLVEQRADLSIENDLGFSALHLAISNNHTVTSNLLIKSGADVNHIVKANSKQSPLLLATVQENIIVLKALLMNGAKVSYINHKGWTALHEASRLGSVLIVRELIAHGADVNRETLLDEDSPLHISSRNGHLEVVKELLDNGADINARNKDGWTALLESIGNEFPVVATELITRGAAPNIKLGSGLKNTPLHMASMKGYLNVVQELLKKGASVFSRNSDGWPPIQEAAKFGHSGIVKELILKGAEIGSDENTALHVASYFGQVEVVEELISAGIDINAINANGTTALHEAITNDQTKIARMLINKGADINFKTIGGLEYTPLQLAIIHNNSDISIELLKKGANISASNANGWTALHEASKSGHISLIKELVSKGANINQQTMRDEEFAPLHLAANKGHLDVVNLFLSYDANIDIKNIYDRTPLFESLEHGHSAIAMALVAKGAKNIQAKGDGRTPLHLAAMNGFHNVISGLIKNGANVSSVDFNGRTALHDASENGEATIVNELLKAGSDVNAATKLRHTPLQIAAMKGHLDVVMILIHNGADVNAKDSNGWNALHEAVKYKHADVVKELLTFVSDIDAKTEDGLKYNAFLLGATGGNLAITKLLLKNGSDVHVQNALGWTALHEVAKHGHFSLVNELLKSGADLNAKTQDSNDFTPLHIAAQYGQLDIVRVLLSNKIDVNVKGSADRTPLYEAVDNTFTDIALELIWNGANNTHISKGLGYSPLQIAAIKGCRKIVQELVKNGANISSTNIYGWTALHEASKFGFVEIVQDLISYGADINARNVDRWTPLQLAAIWGRYKVAKILVLNGADLDAQDVVGKTPLYEALHRDHRRIAELLIKRSAKNIPTKTGLKYSPLQLAAMKGYNEIVHGLLINGANVNSTNSDGMTSLHEASKAGHLEVVKELLKRGADVNSITTDGGGITPLQLAFIYKHQDVYEELMRNGARRDIGNQDIWDPRPHRLPRIRPDKFYVRF